jgi:hypothetical protein
MSDDVFHQVRRGLRHAARAARGAESAALAAEIQQLVVAAVATAQAQEAVGRDAALEEGVELVLDELRQVGPGGHLCVGDEGGGLMLHQAVQRGPFQAVTLAMDRGAIRRPPGCRPDGLPVRLPTWRARTVSSPSLLLNRSEGRPPVGTSFFGDRSGDQFVTAFGAASTRRAARTLPVTTVGEWPT